MFSFNCFKRLTPMTKVDLGILNMPSFRASLLMSGYLLAILPER
jgi:hypothetical protein